VRRVARDPARGGTLVVDALAVSDLGGGEAPHLLQVHVRVPMPNASRSPFEGTLLPPR
jgi:hypothetical protein